jgi:hypothetical protein
MRFATPLHRRLRNAEGLRRRYRDDPAYRLHKVNAKRARKGLPLAGSVDEILTREQVFEISRQRQLERRA